MGKPIGYNPARLQRACLPIMGMERFHNALFPIRRDAESGKAEKPKNRVLCTLRSFLDRWLNCASLVCHWRQVSAAKLSRPRIGCYAPCAPDGVQGFCVSDDQMIRIAYAHSVMAATAAQSTISSTEQPRETSVKGLRRPWIRGPMAVAPARRSVALYMVFPQFRSGNTNTFA